MSFFKFLIHMFCLVGISTLSAGAIPISGVEQDILTFPLYHDNGVVVWRGKNSSNNEFKYSNDQIAWKGKFRKDCTWSMDPAYIYHPNGQRVWMGATRKECTWSTEPAYIYHQNGSVAWMGAFRKECTWSTEPAYIHHHNGKIAWMGALRKECSWSYEPSYFHHDNGAVAWKGAFAKDNSDKSISGLYYDNNRLVWSGKAGDPLYNENGAIIKTKVTAVNLELGGGSWLHLDSKGIWDLYLCLGEDNYLIFSSDNENPIVLIHLGSGYSLCFYPYTGQAPSFFAGNEEFIIN